MVERKAKDAEKLDSSWLGREIIGLVAIFIGLLLLLSLATFDVRDPYVNQVITGVVKIHNRAGLFGAYVSGLLFDVFGLSSWVIAFFFCLSGARRVLSSPPWPRWRWCGIFSLLVCIAILGAARDIHIFNASDAMPQWGKAASHGGGLIGFFFYTGLVSVFGYTGTALTCFFALLLSVQLLIGFSWVPVAVRAVKGIWGTCSVMVRDVPERLSVKKTDQALPSWDTDGGQATASRYQEGPEEEPAEVESKHHGLAWRFRQWMAQKNLLPVKQAEKKQDGEPLWLAEFESGSLDFGKPPADGGGLVSPSFEEQAPLTAAVPPAANTFSSHDAPQQEEAEEAERDGLDVHITAPAVIAPANDTPVKHRLKPARRMALPSPDLLEAAPDTKNSVSRSSLEQKGKALMTCLTDFGIASELVGIAPGPVVTMFEVKPAPGVRVSRIANLCDDLALALKAVAVRIQAPVPGTDIVGIEIPNDMREMVCFKELIGSRLFQNATSLLTLGLGKDISGAAAVVDLAGMPHLLMAGATGAGKSVGINSILVSLLFKARPHEVKLLLIDPKRVEMAIYADLPHLVHPVVTDMAMAKNALEWAVAEMEKRYEDIACAGVRNISDYNAKLATLGERRPAGLERLEPMPYLVIIIDELADLMMVAAKEVEVSIVRLAQLARAAGIHMILATQRPSVDVVTGIIKANFPCRISFQVTSKHDSRTILDTVGAEHLLGKGDMLFKPGGGRTRRMHGAFVSDRNVIAICDYWRALQRPDYSIDFTEWNSPAETESLSSLSGDTAADPLYAEACEFARQQGKISISLIQRRLRIGYNRAANFVEQMEKDGLIAPADGSSKPRTVLR